MKNDDTFSLPVTSQILQQPITTG